MKYLKVFENYQSDEEIDKFCSLHGITNYTIVDGLINVNDDVYLRNHSLTKIPVPFGIVTGTFDIDENLLTSLYNCPKSVLMSFYCSNNELTSLEGIGEVGGEFFCNNNQLTNLVGGPKEIKADYNCDNNKITTLLGGPEKISGSFYCNNNELTSLEGCPDIGDDFDFSNNYVYEFMGVGKIGGSITCKRNPINNIWSELFSDMKHIELFNYMDPIRPPQKGRAEFSYPNRPIVYLSVLNAFLEEIGEEPVTTVKGYKCL
jgi:hypothetical protein